MSVLCGALIGFRKASSQEPCLSLLPPRPIHHAAMPYKRQHQRKCAQAQSGSSDRTRTERDLKQAANQVPSTIVSMSWEWAHPNPKLIFGFEKTLRTSENNGVITVNIYRKQHKLKLPLLFVAISLNLDWQYKRKCIEQLAELLVLQRKEEEAEALALAAIDLGDTELRKSLGWTGEVISQVTTSLEGWVMNMIC